MTYSHHYSSTGVSYQQQTVPTLCRYVEAIDRHLHNTALLARPLIPAHARAHDEGTAKNGTVLRARTQPCLL